MQENYRRITRPLVSENADEYFQFLEEGRFTDPTLIFDVLLIGGMAQRAISTSANYGEQAEINASTRIESYQSLVTQTMFKVLTDLEARAIDMEERDMSYLLLPEEKVNLQHPEDEITQRIGAICYVSLHIAQTTESKLIAGDGAITAEAYESLHTRLKNQFDDSPELQFLAEVYSTNYFPELSQY